MIWAQNEHAQQLPIDIKMFVSILSIDISHKNLNDF